MMSMFALFAILQAKFGVYALLAFESIFTSRSLAFSISSIFPVILFIFLLATIDIAYSSASNQVSISLFIT